MMLLRCFRRRPRPPLRKPPEGYPPEDGGPGAVERTIDHERPPQ